MALKLNFREITPEDTEILRMVALRNGKAEDYLCCDVTNEDGVTQTTWYSKADVALWGEDYIRAHTTMEYSDYTGWIISLDMLMLFTWPILEQFTPEKVKDLISYYRVHKKPMIELANGWYHIEILGGETLQDGDYEPTFEFVIQPATNEEATINADMNFSFEITSSAY